MAVGEVISAFLAGTLKLPVTLGTAICGTQLASGIALGLLTFQFSPMLAVLSLMLLGFFSAPLTIWAQTLRMKIIPSALRGRTFALLRTLMQATTPLGGVVGGVMLPMVILPGVILISALLMGIPGVIGYRVRALRDAE
jgi:MFS family permease